MYGNGAIRAEGKGQRAEARAKVRRKRARPGGN